MLTMSKLFTYLLRWALISSLCFTAVVTAAQQPSFAFKAQLNPDTILIGYRVELTIFASVPSGFDVQFPFFADSLIQGVEVLGKPRIDTLKTKGNTRELLYQLAITSFDSGSYRIPGFRLPFSDGNKNDTVTTTPLWLTVNTLPVDTAKQTIYDIKPPISQSYTFAELAPWIGGGLLLAGIIALVVLYFVRRKKNQPLFFPRKVQEPPHEIALRELERISQEKLWETENSKHYNSVLTDILRNYIEGRFQIPAMEQTTFEIISSFKREEIIDQKLLSDLEQTLTQADLAKFAKYKTTVNENKDSLDFGFRLVNQTMVVEDKHDESPNSDDLTEKPENHDTNQMPVEPINNQEQ